MVGGEVVEGLLEMKTIWHERFAAIVRGREYI